MANKGIITPERMSKRERQPILLTPTSAIEMNLLSVPLSVLNPKATQAFMRLLYEWESDGEKSLFIFERPEHVPFPQVQHAEIFYVMLAMFAQRPNDDGDLDLRLVDVASNAHNSNRGGSTFTTIKEAIWRYANCNVHWNRSWEIKGETKTHTWHGPLIIAENVFYDEELRSLRQNPRRSTNKKDWHTIKFHPLVVQSIKSRFVRVFLTQTLQADISDTAKYVYRYFFRFSDSGPVYRSYEQLMQAFPWSSGEKRFIAWLKGQLDQLMAQKIISAYQFHDDGVSVKCIPIKHLTSVSDDVAKSPASAITGKPRNSQGAAAKKRNVAKWTDEALVTEYFNQRAAGKITADRQQLLDMLIEQGKKDIYLPVLRAHL